MFRAFDLRSGKAVPYVPTRIQRQFHESQSKYRAFVTGIGAGKSIAGVVETLLAAILHPGSFNAVVRWDQSALYTTTFALLEQTIEISGLQPLVKFQTNTKQGSYIEFHNGSKIQGFHGKNWQKFGSLSLSSFFVDEVSELVEPDSFNQLCSRVSRHHIGPNRGWVTGLPNEKNWLWEKFVAKKMPNHEYFGGTSFDNPFTKEGYAEELIQIHGKELAQMLIMGSFDSCEGRLWSVFSRDLHVLRRQSLPSSWPRYAAVDPGFGSDPGEGTDRLNQGDPCAMLRVAVDTHGNIIVEGEYERYDRTTEDFTRDILKVNEGVPPQWYVIDHTAFSKDHRSRNTVAETARRGGMTPLIEAKNTAGYLDQSVTRIRSLLTPMPGRIHPITHQDGCYPQLYVFDDCFKTIQQVQTCRRKKQGAAAALQGIRLAEHHHDLVDTLLFLSLETLHPADKSQPDRDPRKWYLTNQFIEEEDEILPYIHQISRIGAFRK